MKQEITGNRESRDEEEYFEYFRYYPDQGYTEYENASGIIEKYYYDDRYQITKIVH